MRRSVFRSTRVPNEAGGWRSGCEVLEDGDGIASTHLLARECALKLRNRNVENAQQPVLGSASSGSEVSAAPHRGEITPVDLQKLEGEFAEQHRAFLQSWRGRVPSDLVIIYLGLIGRFPALWQLANEWVADATTDVDTLWDDIDRRLKPTLYPNPLPKEVDQRRFTIEEIAGGRVRATALSGDVFDAPLAGESGGIVVGNLHKRSQAIRAADGKSVH